MECSFLLIRCANSGAVPIRLRHAVRCCSVAPLDLSDEDMSVVDSQEEMGGGLKHGGKGLGGHGPSSSMGGPSGGGGGNGGGGGGSGGKTGSKGGDRKSARARTVLSEKQLNILKTCYSANPRPDALMKEQLVEMTGLSPRVIRVWFQNKRCKDKKIQNRLMEKQMQRETVRYSFTFTILSFLKNKKKSATIWFQAILTRQTWLVS